MSAQFEHVVLLILIFSLVLQGNDMVLSCYIEKISPTHDRKTSFDIFSLT